jgi:endo-1,4-beta-mannosidase
VMKWIDTHGRSRQQFMASEENFAEFIRLTLPILNDSGATGAMLWCFADYVPELWDLPPCDNARHERFFGLVRPDGSLKPHAEVIQKFAMTKPTIKPIPAWAKINVNGEEYYNKELFNELPGLYKDYLTRKETASS